MPKKKRTQIIDKFTDVTDGTFVITINSTCRKPKDNYNHICTNCGDITKKRVLGIYDN